MNDRNKQNRISEWLKAFEPSQPYALKTKLL